MHGEPLALMLLDLLAAPHAQQREATTVGIPAAATPRSGSSEA